LMSGRLGIGTSSPNTTLEVVGGNNLPPSTGTQNYTLALRDPTSMVAGVGGSILLQGFKTSTSAIGNFAYIVGKKENGTAGNESGFLSFGTFDSSGNPAERMRITSTGNVGIGVTSLVSPGGSRNLLQISNGINGGQIALGSSTTESNNPRIFSGQYDLGFAAGVTAGIIQFYTNDTERMRITSSGSILIGTTTDNSSGAGNILHQVVSETAAFVHRGPYNIANGGTKTLDVQNGSLIFISENNTGDGALFHACYISATVTIIANPSGRFANTDTASKICVFKSAANGYATLKNNAGSTFQFTTYIIKNSD